MAELTVQPRPTARRHSPARVPRDARATRVRVISVFSTKGGSGKSVTATNIACALAQMSDRPVALIDGHLQFGDVSVMLKLQPQPDRRRRVPDRQARPRACSSPGS
ncbi:MAG: P-loop NTPase [Acidimicrobiales bacterium]